MFRKEPFISNESREKIKKIKNKSGYELIRGILITLFVSFLFYWDFKVGLAIGIVYFVAFSYGRGSTLTNEEKDLIKHENGG